VRCITNISLKDYKSAKKGFLDDNASHLSNLIFSEQRGLKKKRVYQKSLVSLVVKYKSLNHKVPQSKGSKAHKGKNSDLPF
jgi:hypothetical protein